MSTESEPSAAMPDPPPEGSAAANSNSPSPATELAEDSHPTQRAGFYRQIIDSLAETIVVIDETGAIRFANRNWVVFGEENEEPDAERWQGQNYLDTCDRAANMGDELGRDAGAGIRRVIEGEALFELEYPCHSPDEKRWFMMQVTPFQYGQNYFVITHQDITERKLAEERVLDLAHKDGLTNVSNRRHLDGFLNEEWRRCARLNLPLSFAIIDIDHFKLFNDTYGHQAGDDALAQVARTLDGFARRPSDLCARYGGEEFALVLGHTSALNARKLAEQMVDAVRALDIQHETSPTQRLLTVSIGLATCQPSDADQENRIIEAADGSLYEAKSKGRNRVISSSLT